MCAHCHDKDAGDNPEIDFGCFGKELAGASIFKKYTLLNHLGC